MGKIISSIILAIIGMVCIIFWHKKIDSDTTLVYGTYVIIIIILLIFALIRL